MKTKLMKSLIPIGAVLIVSIAVLWSCKKIDTTPIELIPTITSVSPTSGEIGDEVIITGTNFNPAAIYNEIRFNGMVNIATYTDGNTLTTTIPAGAPPGLGKVTVKAYGVTTDGLDFTVIWPPPTITDIEELAVGIGDTITIIGENFSTENANNTVTIGGEPATVAVSTNTELKVVVPSGVTTGGFVNVVLEVFGEAANTGSVYIGLDPAKVEYFIDDSANDVEESLDRDDGHTESGSSDLDMGKFDTNQTPDMGNNLIGVRHHSVMIPQGATIIFAYLQCEAYSDGADPTQMTIYADASDDAGIFDESTIPYGVSSRTQTSASVVWDIPAWVSGERGEAQRTPELKEIVQEVVNRAGWVSGNAMCFMFYPSGPSVGRTLDDGVSGREANGGTGDGPSLVIIYEQ